MNTENKKKRLFVGKVVSDKMDKTVVVAAERVFRHPVFGKVLTVKKTYKVHDPKEEASIGDTVEFFEGRPMSKTKYMYLARIVKQIVSGVDAVNSKV